MADIVLSKGVVRFYGNDGDKLARLERDLTAFRDDSESLGKPWFCPYPPTDEEAASFGGKRVLVNFLALDPQGGIGDIGQGHPTLVMVLPLFVKAEGRDVYYVQLKDEFGKLELDFQYALTIGHQRSDKS